MPTAVECVCCSEIQEVKKVIEECEPSRMFPASLNMRDFKPFASTYGFCKLNASCTDSSMILEMLGTILYMSKSPMQLHLSKCSFFSFPWGIQAHHIYTAHWLVLGVA